MNPNPRYAAFLQTIDAGQHQDFYNLPPDQQEHYFVQWCHQTGQPVPLMEVVNPTIETGLIVTDRQEIAVSPRNDQFVQFGVIHSIQDLERIAMHVAASNIGPKHLHNNPAAAFSLLMYGYEMRISPMVAVYNIHLIPGKAGEMRPSASVHLIRSLLQRSGTEFYWKPRYQTMYDQLGNVVDVESTICFRKKSKISNGLLEDSFTLLWTQAVAAGWTKNWDRLNMHFIMQPTRCTVLGAREFDPSAINGMYELTEAMDVAGKPYELNDEGDVSAM